jgi:hypothetical protein
VLRRRRDLSTKKRRQCELDDLMEERGLHLCAEVGHHPLPTKHSLHVRSELNSGPSTRHDDALQSVRQRWDVRTVERRHVHVSTLRTLTRCPHGGSRFNNALG